MKLFYIGDILVIVYVFLIVDQMLTNFLNFKIHSIQTSSFYLKNKLINKFYFSTSFSQMSEIKFVLQFSTKKIANGLFTNYLGFMSFIP